jgi:hypothetical protein
VGVTDARLELREYRAEFTGQFHDIRGERREHEPLHHPERYDASQAFARRLLAGGSNGIVYRSVRHSGGTCLACFRPRLVAKVRVAGHYEYRFSGGAAPAIHRLGR